MIFEVLKKPNGSPSGPVSYDVLRLFTHDRLLDVFYGPKNYSPVFIIQVFHRPFHFLDYLCHFTCCVVYIFYSYDFYSVQAFLLR